MYKENVMRKDNLVTLKGSDVKTFGTDTMHPNRFYRSIKLTDETKGDVMVYGMTLIKLLMVLLNLPMIKSLGTLKEMGLVKII
jgi:formate-dependent nitrite reductase membrane component NrfD